MDGEVIIGVKLDKSGLSSSLSKLEGDLGKSVSRMEKNIGKMFSFIKGSVITAGIALAFKAISGSIDDAISRLDTMNNYTNVMSNLGVSAEDAQKSIDYMSDKLQGLPTTLNDAVSSVQRFTAANGNVLASTEIFLSLNNAILAGGAPMEQQRSALEQLSQAYAKGKPDMMEWRTAMSAMPAQLKQVGMAMGYASADELGQALRSGKVSMNEFMTTITKLNKEGVAGFSSFEEQARNSTGGVATSITNLRTAITRGLADIMNAIGQSNIAGFFQGIARAINKVFAYIVAFIKVLGTAINFIRGLFGKKSTSGASTMQKSISGASSSMNNLSDGASKTNKGLGNATKSAKKLKKELQTMPFDEMNVLQENTSSSGGSGGGSGAGGAGDMSAGLGDIDLSGLNGDLGETKSLSDQIYENMMKVFTTIGQIMGQGFKLSFGDTNFDGIVQHVQGIRDALVDIGNDPEVKRSAEVWGQTFLFNVGMVVGSIARIGTNIAEGLLGSIDTYLSQNGQRIKDFITNMFTISGQNWSIIGELSKAMGEISDVFAGDTFKQIGADLIASIANPIMSIIEVAQKFGRDITLVMVKPIVDNVDKIKLAFENTLKPIQTVTGTISEAFTYIGDKFSEVYDQHIGPFLQSLASGLSDTFGKFYDVYNEHVAPALQAMADKFSELWEAHLKPLVDKLGEFLGSVFDALTALWEGALKPFIDWVITNIIPVVVPIIETIWDVVVKVFGSIADTVGGIIDVFKGIIDFVVGVFTGDWQKAWDGIKSIFAGLWEFIKGVGSTLMNILGLPFRVVWEFIKGVWGIVASWFNEKIITPLKQFFGNMWNGIKSAASTAWNGIKAVWGVVKAWFNDKIVTPIKTVFGTLWTGLKTGASKAWAGIRGAFKGVASFFGGLWNTIKSKFTSIGTKIGQAVGGAFKKAVNAVFRTLERIVNTPINAINGLIGIINKVPRNKPWQIKYISFASSCSWWYRKRT